jgi:hypothetical protein
VDEKVIDRHGAAFSALSAACLVGLRLLLFESCLFRGTCIPNHDMSQGLAFFATNLQSLRLSGEIAWWNPVSWSGYAQYYQSFLSPVAPTPHHITFIVWSYAVRLLSWLHVPMPSEYAQYLAFNYLLLPFLTYWALGELARGIVRHRSAVVLAVGTYALSSIGIWNAAWFYFQESFTLLFMLAAFVHAARDPRLRRIALLAVAVLIQLSSLNYWSIYNALFLAIAFAVFACFRSPELGRLLRTIVDLVRGRRPVRLGGLLVATTCACWLVLIASIPREQSAVYQRTLGLEGAATRVKGMRTFTIELFNPGIEIALENYPVRSAHGLEPAVHNARYLGVGLLPLLVLAPFLRWRRELAWLITTGACVFVTCFAPSFLAVPISRIPFLNQIQHLFYFYTAHLQLLVVILSAYVLDTVLSTREPKLRGRLLLVSGVTAAAMLLTLASLASVAPLLPGADHHLGSYVRALVVGLVAALLLVQMLRAHTHRARAVGATLLVAALMVDLGWYFARVSAIDEQFTIEYWRVPAPITTEYRERLFEPLPAPDPSLGFGAGLERGLAIVNNFWPTNRYMRPRSYVDGLRYGGFAARLGWTRPLDFFPTRGRGSDPAPPEMLHDGDDTADALHWQALDWSYNDFAFRLTTESPGWLFLRHLYDPLWRYTIDGKEHAARPANFIGTALRVDAGTHELRMTYQPRARTLYGPACALLLITVLFLLGVGRTVSLPHAGETGPGIARRPSETHRVRLADLEPDVPADVAPEALTSSRSGWELQGSSIDGRGGIDPLLERHRVLRAPVHASPSDIRKQPET